MKMLTNIQQRLGLNSIRYHFRHRYSHKRNTCFHKVQHLDRIYHFLHLSFHRSTFSRYSMHRQFLKVNL
nr:MAG TPA: hypothetical protein [Caudoviricetes sp.]